MTQLAPPALNLPARPGPSARSRSALLTSAAAVLFVLYGSQSAAQVAPAMPSGGQVAAGSATIGAPTNARTVIDQSSPKAVINWSSFSIGQGGHVQFNNGAGVTLNRVTGGGSLSRIDGILSASGGLYLLNPNGVIVGATGAINTGGSFIASTLGVSDAGFMGDGDPVFSGASNAGVVNNGVIASSHGDIALIGAQVTNNGELRAPGGDVALGAGREVVLHQDDLDERRLTVTVGGADTSATNAGVIQAASAQLRANGGNVYALAVSDGPSIAVTGITNQDGNVYLVAEGGQVTATGEIAATRANGSGGLVETSGDTINFSGLRVKAGTWLIDPVTLTVDTAAAATINANLATTNVTLKTTSASSSGPGVPSSGAGDININAAIDWSSASTFTVDAYHSIAINAPITLRGGGVLSLITNDGGSGGDYTIARGVSVNFLGAPYTAQLYINNSYYNLIYSADDLPTFDGYVCCNWAVARSFTLENKLYSHAVIGGYFGSQFFFGTFAGLGNTISDININQTISDPQFPNAGPQAKSFVGFFGQIGFAGVVRDLNLTNVRVKGADGMVVGGLAGFNGGTISNVTVSGAVIAGDTISDPFTNWLVYAGGLAGTSSGSIVNSSSSVTVHAGVGTAGGLVGAALYNGSITGSSASGAVDVGSDLLGERNVAAGGLVGSAIGFSGAPVTLSNNFATGQVSGGQQAFVGGFAGSATYATISNAHATGAASGGAGSYVGGFVGSADNTSITTGYATGAVSQTATGISGISPDRIGGFAGLLGTGTNVSLAYASGDVSTLAGPDAGAVTLAGGFVGDLDGGQITNAYALGAVNVTGANFTDAGGFAGLVEEGGSIVDAYATGAVTANASAVGGFAGQVGNSGAPISGGSIADSYWDRGTTGQAVGFTLDGGAATNVTAIGGTTGISPYAQASYGALNFGTVWTLIPGSTRPMLRSEYATTIVNAHQLQLMSLNLAANYTIGADINAAETSKASGVWNPANGFVPLGGTVAAPFTGSLDGGGHTLSNLTILKPTGSSQTLDGYAHNGFVGLFGIVGAAGVVQHLRLANATVTGGDGMLVGALAGAVEGTVSDVSSSGAVTVGNDLANPSGDGSGYASAGGLVGDAAFAGKVINGSSSANVIGGNATAGGLVGTLRSGATLAGGQASGTVTVGSGVAGGPSPEAGGLVGVVNGLQFGGVNPLSVTVSGSHASGAVSGGAFSVLGGFVGATNRAAISTSFATGDVTGGADTTSGGFVGSGLNSTIATSYATGDVSAPTAAIVGGGNVAGGFVGQDGAGLAITNSWAGGDVAVNGAGAQAAQAGVFFGVLSVGGSISGAYATGAVSIANAKAGDSAGGFGGSQSGSVINFYATGPVTSALGSRGGLIGTVNVGGAASTGYWDEGTTGQLVPVGVNTGTLTNLIGVGGATGLNPFQQSSYANFNFVSGWFMIAGQTRPMLRAEYSTSITNAHQLQLMALNLAANYTLANDFDAAETASAHGIWNPANGFVPVGSSLASAFTGVFDGAGHTISNLKITHTAPTSQLLASGFSTNGAVGLFGFAGPASVLRNVSLANVDVHAGDGMVVGALVGSTTGEVVGATSSGVVVVGNSQSAPVIAAAGGLVGDLGDDSGAGIVHFSSSSASVTGGDAYAGGLIGWAHGGAQIAYDFASGAVTVGAAPLVPVTQPYAGGLIGYGQGNSLAALSITQSFATGDVTGGGGAQVGGFAGGLLWVDLLEAYALGKVTTTAQGVAAASSAGGFVGYFESGTIQSAFASGDVETVGNGSAAGGFVGDMEGGQISDTYAGGAVTGDASATILGGFAGTVGGGGLDRILAIGPVSGAGTQGGLIGSFNGDHLNAGYWDVDTTGQSDATGNGAFVDATAVGAGAGLDPFDPLSYPQLDFSSTWSTPSAGFHPQLYRVSHVLKVTPQDAQVVYGDFPIFTFDVLGLQFGDARGIVRGTTASITGGTLSPAGFYIVGTDGIALSGASATGSTGAYRIVYDTGELTITRRPIAPALSGTVQKTYDGNTDATISPLDNSPFIVSGTGSSIGVLPGDDVSIDPDSVPTSGTYDDRNAGSFKVVTATGFNFTGDDLTNYSTSSDSFDFIGQIDQAPLTITAVTDSKTYDGNTGSSGSPFATGFVDDDTLDSATQAFDFRNAGSRTLNVIDYTIDDGNGGGNYAVSLVSASGDIDPAPLTITAVSDTKVYDGTTSSDGAPDVDGLVDVDTATGVTQEFDSRNAGSRTLSVNGYTINDGNGGNNYDVTLFDEDGDITPKPIGAALIGVVEKTYDRTTVAPVTGANLNLPGAIAGDDVSIQMSGAGVYATRNAGTGINVSISGLTIVGDDAPNYTFTDGASAGIGIINAAPLTLTAISDTKIYDGDTSSDETPDAVGLIAGDTLDSATQAFNSRNAGSRTLNVTNYTISDGAGGDNYDVTLVSASGSITPAPLTISAVTDTKVYNGTTVSSGAPIVSGLVDVDTASNLSQRFDLKNAGPRTLAVNGYVINDGNSGANYNVTLVAASGSITPRPLSAALVGTVTRTYNATTVAPVATGNVQLVNAIAGDNLTVGLGAPGVYATRNVGSGILTSIAGLTLGGLDAGNYTFTGAAQGNVGIITAALLTITAVSDTKVYDGDATSDGAPQASGLFGSDSVSGLLQAFNSRNAGPRLLTVTGYAVNDGNGGGNYQVHLVGASGSITPAPLTIAAVTDTRVYNGTTASSGTPGVTGLVGGDTVSGVSQAFDSRNAGSRTLAVNHYTIGDGNSGGNYAVTLSGAAGSITPAALAINALSDEKTYDGTTASDETPEVVGLVAGDHVTGLSQEFDSRNAGSRVLSVGNGYAIADGNNGGNYDITLNDADGEITRALLTISAASDTKVYDGTADSDAAPEVEGLVAGDSVDGLTQAFDSRNAGARVLSVGDGFQITDGNNGDNYAVSLSDATGEITRALLTISAASDTRVYDGTALSDETPTVQGLVAGDEVSGVSQHFDSRNAGSRILSVNGGIVVTDGNGGGNYDLTLIAAAGQTTRPLVISAASDDKTYDGTTVSDETPDVVGLVAGDQISGVSQAFNFRNAGSRVLSVGDGFEITDGNSGGNYAVTLNDADGHITPAALVISAVSDTRTYDGTTASDEAPQVDGLVVGDHIAGVSQAFDSRNAGSRVLSVGDGFEITDGNSGGNYAVTLNDADGQITPAALVISAVSDTKVYDGVTVSDEAPQVEGLVAGDSVNGLTQAFDSRNAGARTLAVNDYTISDGNSGGNYAVTLNEADGEITPAALVISAASDTRTYNGTTVSDAGPNVEGLVAGDSIDGLTQTFNSRNAGARTLAVNNYLISDGNGGGNYTVTLNGADGAITPAALVISANSDTRTYDGTTVSDAAPQVDGLVAGDEITGVSQQFDSRNAGSRVLSVGDGFEISDGNDGGNYAVTLNDADGEITRAPLAISAASETRVYDGTTVSSGAPTVTGLAQGDHVSGLTQSFNSRNAGARTLQVGSGVVVSDGNGGANYIVTVAAANGRITPKPLTVTLIGQVLKAYDGNADASLNDGNYALAGIVAGDTVSLNNPAHGLYDTPLVGRDKTVTVSGLALAGADAGNYQTDAAASGAIGLITIVWPIQPQIVTEPPLIDQVVAPLATQSLTFSGLNGAFALEMSFPVGDDDDDKDPGDNLPVTGTGNGDLWAGSNQEDKDKP